MISNLKKVSYQTNTMLWHNKFMGQSVVILIYRMIDKQARAKHDSDSPQRLSPIPNVPKHIPKCAGESMLRCTPAHDSTTLSPFQILSLALGRDPFIPPWSMVPQKIINYPPIFLKNPYFAPNSVPINAIMAFWKDLHFKKMNFIKTKYWRKRKKKKAKNHRNSEKERVEI